MTVNSTTAWQRECQLQRDLAELQAYHLFDRLRAGEVPAECIPAPPPGRTVFEFAAAAWTTFYGYYFRDPGSAGDHREARWVAFCDRARALYNEEEGDLEPLATQWVRMLEPESAQRDACLQPDFGKPNPFTCFRYDHHADQRYVAMHFANAYLPLSPFDHMDRLFRSLGQIIDDISAKDLAVDVIGCDSWLDNATAFQKCFPPSFAESMTPTDPDGKTGYGWWGQFIDRTGSLHQGRARTLKRTRRFRYARMHAECAYNSFVAHVRQRLSHIEAGQ